ncbi:MAG: lamin tail domain-containing protein [Deltaproteobacteria bacterium]|nr:lamin tail domain-containing protein [Deltaproteobacteria bacterium]
MSAFNFFRHLYFSFALLSVACGQPPTPIVIGAKCNAVVGDLIISELMPAPAGEQAIEWIELFNPTDHDVVLDRIIVSVENNSKQQHEIRGAGVLAPHAYFVIGDGSSNSNYIDYNFGTNLTLNNDYATISLECNHELIDTISYGTTAGSNIMPAVIPGYSISFEGGLIPDHNLNDLQIAWCTGKNFYDPDNHGTPKAPNDLCGTLACKDGENIRTVNSPDESDLIISEIFAKSSLVSIEHGGRDWIELWSNSNTAIDLNGLILNISPIDSDNITSYIISNEKCITILPQEFAVIGAADTPELTGAVYAHAVIDNLSIPNSMAINIELANANSIIIDHAVAPTPSSGKSASLWPNIMNIDANDTPEAFCYSEATGLFDENGTPGKPNLCGSLCMDHGMQRQVKTVKLGDIVLNEIFADPAGADLGRDWIELYAKAAIDLNGVALTYISPTGSSKTWTLASSSISECIKTEINSYVIIGGFNAETYGFAVAATIGSAKDTLLPINPATTETINLQLALGDQIIDEVFYPQKDDPLTPLLEAHSYMRDPLNLQNESLDSHWCVSSIANAEYDGIVGSPGSANPESCTVMQK